jgi:hypothetical protein
MDKDSALALVSMYPGIKEVTSDIEVDPVSIMDDQIRMVDGCPSLKRYAIALALVGEPHRG